MVELLGVVHECASPQPLSWERSDCEAVVADLTTLMEELLAGNRLYNVGSASVDRASAARWWWWWWAGWTCCSRQQPQQ